MEIVSIFLVLLGLSVFEMINSIDNAIINADMLSTMHAKARRWFSTWGLFFAVVVVRGLLPLLILLVMNPSIGIFAALGATFSSDPLVEKSMSMSAPFLLISGGTFLFCLFLHWFLAERKNYALGIEKLSERLFHEEPVWFYTFLFITLDVVAYFALHKDPYLAFGVMLGSTVFFILEGFKEHAHTRKKALPSHGMSDMGKIVFLELLDASFSIDGVIGAFAYTFSVPLILLGNGIGAFVVRKITLGNIHRIKHYPYLKNASMYSMGMLGMIMMIESFGYSVPAPIAPLITISIVLYFLWRSHRHAKRVGTI